MPGAETSPGSKLLDMADDDAVEALAMQAVQELMIEQSKDVDDIESSLQALMEHLEKFAEAFSLPALPPGN